MGGHGHEHGIPLGASSTREGLRAVGVGIIGLAITTVLQAVVVVLTGSIALLADTAHNGLDVVATLVVGLAFLLSGRKPSPRFSFGLHRIEDLAGAVVVVMIFSSALFIAYESIDALRAGSDVSRPWVVLAAGLIGFAGNELVAQYKIAVGRKIGSEALLADGHHSRADGLTSLAVVVAALGVLAGLWWLDAAAGLAVAAVIAWSGYGSGKTILFRLLDGSDADLIKKLHEQSAGIANIDHINDLRVRHSGRTVHVIASVCLPADLTLREAHDATELLRDSWLHVLPEKSTVDIHADPFDGESTAHPADEHSDKTPMNSTASRTLPTA